MPTARNAIDVKFYTKPDCPLCDAAALLLEAVGRRQPLRVQPVNILSDSALYRRYRHRIPVLLFPDETVLEPPITRDRLLAAIRRQFRP